ncbi:MAG: hypothetical protein M0D55_19455 [Elusimicrobiota bacterium]|nr:MAG: hypothetical protein M0D55_19455 [Elusimicrobiota bacterium]
MEKTSPLDGLTVASPCTESWDKMTGDERVRACAKCRLNVYNLSEMTKREAESLLVAKEGRLCVRFYRRHDGTVITKDCPVGLRAARLKLAKLTAGAFALVAVLAAGLGLRRKTAECSVETTKGRVNPLVNVIGGIRSTAGEARLQGKPALMGAPPPVLQGDVATPERQ